MNILSSVAYNTITTAGNIIFFLPYLLTRKSSTKMGYKFLLFSQPVMLCLLSWPFQFHFVFSCCFYHFMNYIWLFHYHRAHEGSIGEEPVLPVPSPPDPHSSYSLTCGQHQSTRRSSVWPAPRGCLTHVSRQEHQHEPHLQWLPSNNTDSNHFS